MQHPKHYFSNRYNEIMSKLLANKRDLMTKYIERQRTVIQTYQLEDSLEIRFQRFLRYIK